MLKDIYPGSGSSETLYPFTEYDGKLYFSADNGSNGDELWVLSNDNIPGDVTMFLEDFGRSQFNNPCPACVAGDWCVY